MSFSVGLAAILAIIDYSIEWKIYPYVFTISKDLSEWIISRPKYGQYSLLLLIILIIVIIFLLIKWSRLYSTYERFKSKFGTLWGNKKRMRCLNCHKLLKYSTLDSSTFFCSDPKCNNKHFLRDETGSPITEREAIEKMKN